MKNFKEGGRKGGNSFGGKPKFGGSKFGGNDRGGNRFGGGDKREHGGRTAELFPARCSTCQKNCEVPFRPSSDKPVYCSACFNKKNDDATREYYKGKENHSADSREAKPQRDQQPVRHEMTRVQTAGGSEEIKRQLDKLENKLNRILEIMSAAKSAGKISIPKVEVEAPQKTAVKSPKSKPKVVITKAVKVTKKPVTKAVTAKPVAKKAVKKVAAK